MRRLCLLLLLLAGIGALACGQAGSEPEPEILVRVQMVAVDDRNSPVLILEEEGGSRVLPIWIGTAEATSIAAQINKRALPRPNFHDLARRVIQHLEAEVERVVVTELRAGTYYALLSLRTNGRSIDIDVRPSDGIAVALRAEAPILVRASVFEAAGETPSEVSEGRSIDWCPGGKLRFGMPPATRRVSL